MLLILVVLDYFQVILLNFHCTIVSFPLLFYFFYFYVCEPLTHLAWSANLYSVIGNTPISFHVFFICCLFSFCGLTPSPTLNYNLVFCLFSFHSLFCLICCLMAICWDEIGYPCMQGMRPSLLVVLVLLTLLFSIPWFDISLYLRLSFMVSTNQCFYQDTISRKMQPKAEEVFLPMRHTIPHWMLTQYFIFW